MFTKILFSYVMYVLIITAVESGTSYDQSQTGDLNVQVDLKGLHILALMKGGKEEYVDYDYAYDYSEMTIKPLNGTTPKPLNVTNAVLDKENASTTSSPGPVAVTTNSYEDTALPTLLSSTSSSPENSSYNESGTIDQITPATTDYLSYNSSTSLNSTTTNCKKGFVINQKGECELKLQNAGTNALLKLVKLSQKLKLRRERNPARIVKPHHGT